MYLIAKLPWRAAHPALAGFRPPNRPARALFIHNRVIADQVTGPRAIDRSLKARRLHDQ